MFEKQHETIEDIKRKLKVIEQHHKDKPLSEAAVNSIDDAVKKLHGVVEFHHNTFKDHIKT